MWRVDPHFERIAARLGTLQLHPPDDDDGVAFVRAYNEAGLQTVIREYGLDEKLQQQGLGDYRVMFVAEDPFRHRLELVLPDGTRIMDLRLHLCATALPGVPRTDHVDVVVVEWLLMQNPRRTFTRERPRLPGQRHPGTGLGADVSQLLVLMCRRIGRDGLLIVPERFHLAELYARGGWLAPDPAAERDIDDVVASAHALSFAARAWAVERGFVLDEAGAPWTYTPHERILPVSERLAHALAPGGMMRLRALLAHRRELDVDTEGLARSLTTNPVEGMDPAHLGR